MPFQNDTQIRSANTPVFPRHSCLLDTECANTMKRASDQSAQASCSNRLLPMCVAGSSSEHLCHNPVNFVVPQESSSLISSLL